MNEYDINQLNLSGLSLNYLYHITENNCTKHYIIFNGKPVLHRVNGPAVEYTNKDDFGCNDWYYQFGKLHRDDGPAMTENSKHLARWYWHGTEIFANNLYCFKKQIKLLCLK